MAMSKRAALAYLLTVLMLLCATLTFAQGDDVHIQPRVAADPKVPDLAVDATLNTHTKAIRKDVDIVLIPVTITDPSNRLVTGLEKDNFTIFEGAERQEIKHFSSEDAPISLGVI